MALESLHFSLHKGALHFLRKIIALKDELYTCSITQGNLLAPLVQALLDDGATSNLLPCAVLELLEFLRLEFSTASARTQPWPLSSAGPVQPPASMQVSPTASDTAGCSVPCHGKMNPSFQIPALAFRINLNCFMIAPDRCVLVWPRNLFLCQWNSEAF